VSVCVYVHRVHLCVCMHLRVWTQSLCVGVCKYVYAHRVHVCVCVYFRIDTPGSHVGMYVFPYICTDFILCLYKKLARKMAKMHFCYG